MIVLAIVFFIALCTAAGAFIGIRLARNPVVTALAGFAISLAVTAAFIAYSAWILAQP